MIKKKIKTLNMYVPITGRCNQHCDFCEVPLFKFKNLSLEDFKKIFDDNINEFDADEILINIGGGETLLNENLCSILKFCQDYKIKNNNVSRITLFTNGKRLSDKEFSNEFFSFLIKNNINLYFVISTTIFSKETQLGIKNLIESDYYPEHLYIKAVVSNKFISQIDTWYNNLLPIITTGHKKKVAVRFRFINLKFLAEKNGYQSTYKEVMPALEKYIGLLIDNNIFVQSEFFPWCIWNDKKLFDKHQAFPKTSYNQEEQNGVYIEKCNSCFKKDWCNGFTKWTIPDESEMTFS